MAYNEETETTDQSAWNLSQADILLMSEFLRRAASQSLNGLIVDCYYTTKEIRFLIHTDLKKDEDTALDKLENDIQQRIGKARIGNPTAIKELGNYLIKYRKYIRELLGKYGYLMTKKEDSAKLY